MDEFIAELISALEEIMAVEDEKFVLVKDLALQTMSMTLTGAQADNTATQVVLANKAAGTSRFQMLEMNKFCKDTMYKVIAEEFKTRYQFNADKCEFLDKMYGLIESYCDKLIELWDLESPEVFVELLHENAKMPSYAKPGDQGADIYACEDITIPANSFGTIVKTGLAMAIPSGWAIAIRPRSGMSCKTRIRISNTPGTIDTNYKDEIGVIIDNFDNEDYIIHAGDRIAQFVLERNYQATFSVTDDVHKHGADREGGFGSTGV